MWDSNPLSAYDIALLVRGFFMENYGAYSRIETVCRDGKKIGNLVYHHDSVYT